MSRVSSFQVEGARHLFQIRRRTIDNRKADLWNGQYGWGSKMK